MGLESIQAQGAESHAITPGVIESPGGAAMTPLANHFSDQLYIASSSCLLASSPLCFTRGGR